MFLAADAWAVVQVVPRSESKVAVILQNKSYDCFLPMRKKRSGNSPVPLFSGYVFCRPTLSAAAPIVTTPGVVRIVSFGGKPAWVTDEEIRAIQQVLASGNDYQPSTYLRVGREVRIVDGPLQGLTGFLKQIKNKRKLVISINLLMRSVEVETGSFNIEELHGRTLSDRIA